MVKQYRRFITFALSALVAGLTLAANTLPAQAASRVTAVVDDDLACPRAAFTNIQDAINFVGASAGTITVCPGVYRGTFQVANANNLTITAKKGAVIAPPVAPALFTGVLLTVQTSKNVTVQGFTFDGESRLQTFGDPNAIEYFDASGMVKSNSIVNWHRSNFAGPDLGPGGVIVGALHAIHLIGMAPLDINGHPANQVRVMNNTIVDYQEKAIHAEGRVAVAISGNKLSAGLPPLPPAANVFSIGITLEPLGDASVGTPAGSITGNTITGHGGPQNDAIDSGILLKQTSGLNVSTNTLTHVVTGISFFTSCVSSAGASNNTVKANKINESINGIEVTAIGGFPNVCDVHADHYVIMGNKIVNNIKDPLDFGLNGIVFDVRAVGGSTAFAQNEVVKGNTITFFNVGVNTLPQTGGVIQGVFTPNNVKLAL